jgi:hypothetical protein
MMQKRLILCAAALLAAVVLVVLLGALTGPSNAQTSTPPLAGRAAASASSSVTPTTYVTTIVPGVPMAMGDTDVILEFAPGASGLVTVTMVPTTPVDPPVTGAIPMNWHITTTATSYEVTATFVYSRAARDADVALVFDQSGSMEYDTLCYGCWEQDPFPGGTIYPLKWSQDGPTATASHCLTGNVYDTNYYDPVSGDYFTWQDEYYRRNSDNGYFIVIEAEEYSSYDTRADYHQWQYSPYRTFWVIQRNAYNFDSATAVGALGRDSRGGYISHHPFPNNDSTSGYGVSCRWSDVTSPGYDGNGPYCDSVDSDILDFGGPFPVPRVDYAFTAPSSGTYYFWVRAQGGQGNADDDIFWGVTLGSTPLRYPTGQETNFRNGANYDGARGDRWDWERLGSVSLSAGQSYVLSFWGGGAGFDIDRIIVTDDSTNYVENGDETDNGDYLPLKNSPPNNARVGWACESCDPRFAGLPGGLLQGDGWWLPDCSVGDQSDDPIYDGEMPIRPAIDAATRFVSQINHSCDQVGYVAYSTSSNIRSELECLRRLGPGGCTADAISATVTSEVYTTTAGGSTNMAAGIMDGIEVLRPVAGHYGRPEATHNMILLTDGVANREPNAYCDDDPDRQWPGGSAAQDCVIYYAHEARANGIVIHTISLGYSADLEIMQAVADLTGGVHRWAPSPDKLDDIFDEILTTPLILHSPYPDVEAIYHRDTPTSPWRVHPLDLTDSDAATWTITGTDITALSQWTLGPATPQAPHHVTLEANPTRLPADGVATAAVTATVVDVYGLCVQDGTPVALTTSLGTVAPITATTTGGEVTGTLTAGTTAGQATVTAAAEGVSGTIRVTFTPLAPYQITLEASPTALPADGAATAALTATVADVHDNAVQDGTVVTFTTSLGAIVPVTAATTGGVVTGTLTAGTAVGQATVTAAAEGVSDTIQVTFAPLAPHQVTLEASPTDLPADGAATAALTATVADVHDNAVQDGTVVTFTTSLGAIAPVTATTTGGVATTTFTSSLTPGSATVTATVGSQTGTVTIQIGEICYLPLIRREEDD